MAFTQSSDSTRAPDQATGHSRAARIAGFERESDGGRRLTPRDVAIVVGCTCAAVLYAWWYYGAMPGFRPDFDFMYESARALLRGENPYEAVGPGKPYDIPWPMFYPTTMIVMVAPLATLPLLAARLLFVACSAAILAVAILRTGNRWLLAAFLSQGALSTFALGQWSALMLAIVWWPAMGWLMLAKPNIGGAMFAGHILRRLPWSAVVAGLMLIALTFAVRPGWIGEWLPTLQGFGHGSAPITRSFGILIALAVLRWRRPEARVLLALACVPQTPAFYDGLLFFAFARTRLECLALAVLTHGTTLVWEMGAPWGDFDADAAAYGRIMVGTLFLPSLIMVLRRPNEGFLAPPLERLAARLPEWLRGARPRSSGDAVLPP